MWWSVALTAVGVTATFLTLKKKLIGPFLAICSQVLWLSYAVSTKQWGFLGSVAIYGPLNAWGFLAWRKEKQNAGK